MDPLVSREPDAVRWRQAMPQVALPLLLAALGAAFGEALVGFGAAGANGLSGLRSLQCGYYTWGLAAWPAIPLVLAVAALASTGPVLGLGRGLVAGLGGAARDGGGHVSAALLSGGATFAVAAGSGVAAGLWMVERLSPSFAIVGTVLATLGALAGAMLVAPLGGQALSRVFRTLELRGARAKAVTHPALLLVVTASVLWVLLRRWLPPEYAPAPVVALLGFAVGLVPAVANRVGQWLRERRFWFACAGLWLAAAPVLVLVDFADPAVQETLLYRPPHVSLLVGAAHRLLDRDGDGYSPVLMGGDCDDGDAAVNPGATEVAGNGEDEDCSGADAGIYVPPARPVHSRPQALPERPNIVLIQIEALRPDRMGFNGYERALTPNLDVFRRQATLFERAYTPAPSTRFAMASMFTGLDPIRLPQKRGKGNDFELQPQAVTVAELLREGGYDTFGLSISYVLQHNRGTGQGWRVWKTPWPVNDWAKTYGTAGARTTEAALDYLAGREPGAHPFMLFTHYRCPHDPYIKHPEWDFGDEPSDVYDSTIAYCDVHVGRLLDGLRARADFGRTAVFVFSDHGELFGEHGLTNHGNSLFETDVRIVMLARVPGATSETVEAPVRLTDLGPTVLELAGLPEPPGLDGWSLVPLFFGAPADAWWKRPIMLFTDIVRGTVKVRAAGAVVWPWKLIRNRETGRRSLYQLDEDPAEERDLAEQERERLAGLDGLLEAWLARSTLPD